jgi:hypothetical protein
MTNEKSRQAVERLALYAVGRGQIEEANMLIALVDQRDALRIRAEKAEAERDDFQSSFELRWKADMRAIQLWQETHPGDDLVWPNHVDLVVWLLGERARLREAILAMDAGLSRLWPRGPVAQGHQDHIEGVDEAWAALRVAVR